MADVPRRDLVAPLQHRSRARGGWPRAARASGADREVASDVDVGGALRRLREARGLSIRTLAARSGLAVNTLSLIEHARTSPSVSTLQCLARALDVPIAAFFETDERRDAVVHVTADRRSRAIFAHGVLENLGAGFSGHAVQPFVVTLEPGADSGASPIVHTGEEFVLCLAGRIVYVVADATYRLADGDSLLFAAHLPHRWRNEESAPAEALLVLSPSDTNDRPSARHFAPLEDERSSALTGRSEA